jgi:hypothetical protein
MGHSPKSRMYEVYVKEFGNEGNRKMKLLKGIITEEDTISDAERQMQPKTCPICHTSNHQSALFCKSCNFIISQKGYLEMKEEEKKIKEELEELRRSQRKIELKIETMFNEEDIDQEFVQELSRKYKLEK